MRIHGRTGVTPSPPAERRAGLAFARVSHRSSGAPAPLRDVLRAGGLPCHSRPLPAFVSPGPRCWPRCSSLRFSRRPRPPRARSSSTERTTTSPSAPRPRSARPRSRSNCGSSARPRARRRRTGTGGVTAVPLLTKGRGESDDSNLDMNWFLGIRGTDNVLVRRLRGGRGPVEPGPQSSGRRRDADPAQHLVSRGRDLRRHDLAALPERRLEQTLVVGANRLPQWREHPARGARHGAHVARAAPSGYFAGVIDEPRVWNFARSGQEIADNWRSRSPRPPAWSAAGALNDGRRLDAVNSAAAAANGTLTNGPLWIARLAVRARQRRSTSRARTATSTFGDRRRSWTCAQFTIETWFRRDGAGVTANTGTGGVTAIPLVTKGVGEAEASNVDMN